MFSKVLADALPPYRGRCGPLPCHSLDAPGFGDFLERAGADFLQTQAGGGGFGFGDGSAGDATQEEVQQPLADGGVVEDIAEEGGLGGFFDEGIEPEVEAEVLHRLFPLQFGGDPGMEVMGEFRGPVRAKCFGGGWAVGGGLGEGFPGHRTEAAGGFGFEKMRPAVNELDRRAAVGLAGITFQEIAVGGAEAVDDGAGSSVVRVGKGFMRESG